MSSEICERSRSRSNSGVNCDGPSPVGRFGALLPAGAAVVVLQEELDVPAGEFGGFEGIELDRLECEAEIEPSLADRQRTFGENRTERRGSEADFTGRRIGRERKPAGRRWQRESGQLRRNRFVQLARRQLQRQPRDEMHLMGHQGAGRSIGGVSSGVAEEVQEESGKLMVLGAGRGRRTE